MIYNSILVPTDLTSLSKPVMEQAVVIAKRTGFSLTLLHVLDDKTKSAIEIDLKLKIEGRKIHDEHGVNCEVIVREGNIFNVIPEIANDIVCRLMVIGTHGLQGLKQKLFGADILKLINKVPAPVMVIQENSKLIADFKTMVFPVSSHKSFKLKIEAALLFAGIYDQEIHIYSVERPGFDWPERLKDNIELARKTFEAKGIPYKRVNEKQNVYSAGYAKQILQYAEKVNADMICIMSVPSEEYFQFAQSDKEAILTNKANIPVLCRSDELMRS